MLWWGGFVRLLFDCPRDRSFGFHIKRRVGRCQPRDGDTIGRAAHIVQSNLVAESDRTGIAAVFAADSYFQIRLYVAATLGAEAHQLAYAFAVKHLKRIVDQNLPVDVGRQEPARVIATQTERRLRQVVCAEREKVGVFSDFAGGSSGACE